MERYGNVAKQIEADVNKGKLTTVNIDKPNTTSVVDLIVSVKAHYKF